MKLELNQVFLLLHSWLQKQTCRFDHTHWSLNQQLSPRENLIMVQGLIKPAELSPGLNNEKWSSEYWTGLFSQLKEFLYSSQ